MACALEPAQPHLQVLCNCIGPREAALLLPQMGQQVAAA